MFALSGVVRPGPADTVDDQDEDDGSGDPDHDANEEGEVLHLLHPHLGGGGAAVLVVPGATAVAGGAGEPGVPFTNWNNKQSDLTPHTSHRLNINVPSSI